MRCLVILMVMCWSVVAVATPKIHEHSAKEVGDYPKPKIQLSVFRDPMDGVNVHVSVDNYLLNAPDSETRSDGSILEGHAHVFVNGIKRQRLYGHDIHIPQTWLKKGVNQIAISLNSHQHENWTINKEMVVGSVFIDLAKESLVLHAFSSQPLRLDHSHH